MKKIVTLLLIASCILFIPGCKKIIDSITPVFPVIPEVPVPTEIGTPIDIAVIKNIGTSGGTINSADGKVELEIPVGALAGNTDIGIQVLTNNAPNGTGNAYRFTPDGTVFSKPVTLKIHYTDNGAGTLPDLTGIAYQDYGGTWYRVNNFINDVAAKTITAPISHFSDWTLFDAMSITPSSATIRANQTVNLAVTYVNTADDTSSVAPLLRKLEKVTWFANSIENGNASAGTFTTGADDKSGIYKAPSKIPAQNPVAVTAQVQIKFVFHGKTFDKTSLISNITIFDGDEVYLLEMRIKDGSWFQGMVAIDSVSMKVKINDTTVTISGITNFPSTAIPEKLVVGNSTVAWIPDPIGELNIINATGNIAIDFFGPGTRFLGLDFMHSGTLTPAYHITTPPNLDQYYGGGIAAFLSGTSFQMTDGKVYYDNGPPDINSNLQVTVKLSLQP